MKLAAIAKLIKTDEYCKLYKVFYNDGQGVICTSEQKQQSSR